jgi:uncharacterized protein YqhQ
MAGVVLMLVVAALLEGFARQLDATDMAGRFIIGLFMLALWLAYIFAAGRAPQGDRA